MSHASLRALCLCLCVAACGASATKPPDGSVAVDPDAGDDASLGDADLADASAACTGLVAAPDVDPWSVRVASAGFGGITTAANGGHSDVFLSSPASGGVPANHIRIGARLDWGGTIVFFGLGANPSSNVIDANDPGRELQVALYDPSRIRQPCAGTATCATSSASCGNSITYLGWDPVQGGDECGHGATSTYTQAGDALRLVVNPLQWNPDWDKPDCVTSACGPAGVPVAVVYTIDLRFVSTHVVEIMTEAMSNETFDHPVTAQEFPTLYVNHGQGGPDLPVLLDANQQPVTIATPANDGFLYDNFTSPAPWVSWQNTTRDYGVGLLMDQGITAFQGWRGEGGSAPYFHNVRAQIEFGLRAGKRVRGLSYLALGGIGTVAGELAGVLARRPPFGALDVAQGAPIGFSPGSPLAIAGWALDSTPLANVRVDIDGATVATLPVGTPRPDVCEIYPAYGGCPNPGFAGEVPTTGLTGCHVMKVVTTDVNGNATTLGERLIFSM